ncbi:anti-sigma factor [Kribbella catacumbae]|uniref:anti-sigma factor n=1 Tax=Kribbella catacumbae TaxID=460086 RepID=UPI00037DECD6|nr:anti-sigma factor [Kribbella catacumbae]
MTTTPDVHTLTGPYVLDALPGDERLEFEQHVVDCAACGTEVNELREAAVKLASGVATVPPSQLKARVLAAVSQVRQHHPILESEIDGMVVAPRRSLCRWPSLTLAAAAMAVALAGGIALDQYRDNTAISRQNHQMAAVLAEPDARTVHGKVSGGGQATVVASTRRDTAVVVLKGLQPLSSKQTYQLWLIDSTQTAHSIGLVDGRTAGELTKVIAGGVAGKVAFGLTVEPEGGSAKPTHHPAALIPMV